MTIHDFIILTTAAVRVRMRELAHNLFGGFGVRDVRLARVINNIHLHCKWVRTKVMELPCANRQYARRNSLTPGEGGIQGAAVREGKPAPRVRTHRQNAFHLTWNVFYWCLFCPLIITQSAMD